MARGLEHIRFYGFAHNDVKPENILVFKNAEGELVAKVADLGCALGAYPACSRSNVDTTIVSCSIRDRTLLTRIACMYIPHDTMWH